MPFNGWFREQSFRRSDFHFCARRVEERVLRAPVWHGQLLRPRVHALAAQVEALATLETREIERLGFRPEQVTDIVLTHGDVDHAGGLADFPHAQVHLSEEEANVIRSGNPRYIARQFAHGPSIEIFFLHSYLPAGGAKLLMHKE